MKRVTSILFLVLAVSLICAPASAAMKEWTFMVFVNADNNLDAFGADDRDEMVKGGGSNEWRNVVFLIDREHGPATLNYITKTGVEKIKDMGELDMGDYRTFVKFVVDTAKAYPAKHYAAAIWNHGSGWKDAHGEIIKGISYDDSSNNHITTGQLTIAMAEIKKALGKKLDVLGFDACLMQMMEVAYAVKDHVGYLVASEETEPGEGWCYDDIGKAWKPGMDPKAFASMIVKEYAKSYSGGSAGSSSTTQSALDCTKLGALKDAIDGLAKAAIAGSYVAEFKDALNKVQKFYYRTNIDLVHYVQLLKNSIKDEGFQTAAIKLEKAAGEAIVQNGLSGYNTKNAKGLAIYFPSSSYSFSTAYNDLAFAHDSLWDEMVQDYYKKMTAATVVADVQSGDLSSLMSYVKTANENNREVSSHLIKKLNFAVFTESTTDEATQNNVKNLVKELKSK